MSLEQIQILVVLVATISLFLWGRWRHDVVALMSLLTCVILGLVPAQIAFEGFGHPAVITVACVLVLSWGLQATGAVNVLADYILPKTASPTLGIASLITLGAVLSAFMNNVGAMALLMPVAIQLASRYELAPGKILMPLSFATILGGMTTLIGTPPNLIISAFRAESTGSSFAMFDFSGVGVAIAAAGLLFVTFLGWRIVPARQETGTSAFDTGKYLTEARITEKCKAVGMPLREVEHLVAETDAQVVGMVRNDLRIATPNPHRILRAGDVLVIEAEPEALEGILSSLGMTLEEAVETRVDEQQESSTVGNNSDEEKKKTPPEIELQEMVVMPGSSLAGRSASDTRLRTRYGVNLLAISRKGSRSIKRLRSARMNAGDVLLMQGETDALSSFAGEFGCVPLAQRAIQIPDKGQALVATVIMVLAIAGAAFGLVPAAIAFATGVLVFILTRIIPVRKVYESIDWPVIVLLAALLPVAAAMGTTGAADLIARTLLEWLAQGNPVVALAVILAISMTLSDFMNNAATAAMMCPIAISSATQLDVNSDTFLMAVAIGASCAFLTPIGHQNNTLILGPGGFRFGDYWKLGLPMELLVILIGIPMLLIVWPL